MSDPTKPLPVSTTLSSVAGSSNLGLPGLSDVRPFTPVGIEGMSTVQETFAAAATAARNLLPTLEKQRLQYISQIQAIDATIKRLTAVIESADFAVGATGSDDQPGLQSAFSLASNDIDQVMYESEQPLKVNEINDRIKAKFGREWAASTIYGHLNKAKSKGQVVNSGGRWIMTDPGRDDVTFPS